MGYDTESAAVGEGLARFIGPDFPQYQPALSPESTVRGLEVLSRVHGDAGVPATLFTCGRTLLHAFEAVEQAAASGLFDVQSHTYSHVLFRDVSYEPSPGTVAVIPAAPPVAPPSSSSPTRSPTSPTRNAASPSRPRTSRPARACACAC